MQLAVHVFKKQSFIAQLFAVAVGNILEAQRGRQFGQDQSVQLPPSLSVDSGINEPQGLLFLGETGIHVPDENSFLKWKVATGSFLNYLPRREKGPREEVVK